MFLIVETNILVLFSGISAPSVSLLYSIFSGKGSRLLYITLFIP